MTTTTPAPVVSAPSSKILIVGEGHNVVKQFPMFKSDGRSNAPLYWWAEKGYIHWEDSRPPGQRPRDYYGLMSYYDFGVRVTNLSAMVYRSSEDGHYSDERRKMQQFINDAEKLIRTAKAHGGLHDKGASEHHKRTSATSVMVPKQFSKVIMGDGNATKLGQNQKKMADPFNL